VAVHKLERKNCTLWFARGARARCQARAQEGPQLFPTHFDSFSLHHHTYTPLHQRQVTVVAKNKLSLTRTSRSLFSSLSTLAPKAAGPALVLASRAVFTRSEWSIRSSTVTTVQQTRFASNKDKKNRNMPPKKVVEEKKVLLGRPGNNLNAGIVCTNMYVLCTISSALVAN
jgi:hypothetical protein